MVIVAIIILPLLTILIQLFEGPGEMWGHIVNHTLMGYISNSLWLILGCSIFTCLFGVSTAWMVSRYHFYFSSIFEWALILPLAIPSYITAYAYAGLFDYGGPFSLLLKYFGVESFKFDIMNLPGLVFVLSVSLFPYVYIVTRAVFMYQSGKLIESSKLLGSSELKTFFKIILPMGRPAIVGGLLLVVMEIMNDYGAAKYYGVSTFTTGIFRAWFSLEDQNTAIYLCAILLVIIFTIIGIEKWQRRNKSYAVLTKGNTKLQKLPLPKKHQYLVLTIVSLPFLLGFALPISQLAYWSILTFKKVVSLDFIMISLNSLGIAFLTALITVFFAVMILYFPKWNPIRLLKKSSKLVVVGYAIPGAVLAIGVMIPTLLFDKWIISTVDALFSTQIGLFMNGTLFTLLYAYMVRFSAIAFNPLSASQLKIGASLSESSRLLGKGVVMTFFKIDLPLLKPALISAFILVFIDTMKELPLTLILKPYHVETLAIKAYEYASDEQILESSLPSLCIIAVGIIPIIILNKLILNGKV